MPPFPPSELLDAQERQMARAMRNLPSALPPPELDARILGASRRAIALTPKPRSRRGLAWGLSSAAAAVLALGIVTKMQLDHRDAAFEPTMPAPASVPPLPPNDAAPAESAAASDVVQDESAINNGMPYASEASPPQQQVVAPALTPTISEPELAKDAKSQVDVREAATSNDSQLQAAKADASATATRKQEALQDRSERDKANTDQAAARNGPEPFPAASKERASAATGAMQQAPIVLDTPTTANKASGGIGNAGQLRQPPSEPTPPPPPPPASAQVGTFAPPAAKVAAPPSLKPATPPVESSPTPTSGADEGAASLDTINVAGSRLRQTPATLPPVDSDATLAPAQWIERIRLRVSASDGRGARESLRRLLARYPQTTVPADLAPLRQ
ncbi:MAG: hypothetical protein ABIQ97_05785 [Lysobacteraceae bacterium]